MRAPSFIKGAKEQLNIFQIMYVIKRKAFKHMLMLPANSTSKVNDTIDILQFE